MRGPDRNYEDGNINRVRKLRSEMSESEKKLYARLRDKKLGYKFRRQHPIGPYALDFYCPKLKLCLEVDGEQHLLTQAKDARRDEFLASFGVLTVRIPSLELFGENGMTSQDWENQIVEICEARFRGLFPGKDVPVRKILD